MQTASGPDGPTAAELTDAIDGLAHRVGRFLQNLNVTADDVEIWIQQHHLRGRRVVGHEVQVESPPERTDVAFRTFRDGAVGRSTCSMIDEAAWRDAINAAIKAATPSTLPVPAAPSARRPGPMTFDPDLADGMSAARTLERVGQALCANAWHEGERIQRLDQVSGRVWYQARKYVVGNRRGILASLHGELRGEVELNGIYGDLFHQTHMPESFLPLALLGARTWRTMPRQVCGRAEFGAGGRMPVVLHPRMLERLLRGVGGQLLSSEARRSGSLPFGEGERIAGSTVTLIDDPGLDGMAASRAFDDEGVPTKRTPIIVRGRLTELLRSRAEAIATATTPTGNAWRDAADFARDPQQNFGSLLMERGDLGFHDMVGAVPKAILVHDVKDLTASSESTGFRGTVRWGVTLERGGTSRLLTPGDWHISGHLFSLPGQPPGLLEDVVFSRELYDTGSAILPYCLCFMQVS